MRKKQDDIHQATVGTLPRFAMQPGSTQILSIILQQQAEIEKKLIKHPVKTTEEDMAILSFDETVSNILPAPLTNQQQNPALHALLHSSLDQETAQQYRREICQVNPGLLDSTSDLLMMDPVRTAHSKARQASEREKHRNKPLHLYDAGDISAEIELLLNSNRKLEDIQYLPTTFQQAMAEACLNGETDTIRKLYEKNRRLLWTTDSHSKKMPLQHAIQNEKSLDVVIELLELRQEGFALANLLHPDEEGRLPLENALRSGHSLMIVLKIMAWMGDTLQDTFTLTEALPKNKKSMLNQLLLVCILRNRSDWAKAVMSWGANLQDVITLAKECGVNKIPMMSELISASSTPAVSLTTPNQETKDAFSSSQPQETLPAPTSIPTLPRPRPRVQKNDSSQLTQVLQEKKAPYPSKLFTPAPDMDKLAICFVQAIIDNNINYVQPMCRRYPGLVKLSVNKKDLKKLAESDITRPRLTALQCAFRLHRTSMYEIILPNLTEQEAILQLGGGGKGRERLETAREGARARTRYSIPPSGLSATFPLREKARGLR